MTSRLLQQDIIWHSWGQMSNVWQTEERNHMAPYHYSMEEIQPLQLWLNRLASLYIFIDTFTPNTYKGCFSCHAGFISCTTAPPPGFPLWHSWHILLYCGCIIVSDSQKNTLHWNHPKHSFIHTHYIWHGNRSEYATTEKKGTDAQHNTSKQNWL